MPSQSLCDWCGRAIVGAPADPVPGITASVCQQCADWHKARGHDEEDCFSLEGLGGKRPTSGPRDRSPQT